MALESKEEIRSLAEVLTDCASSMHERIVNAIKTEEINRDQARNLFDDELTLRQCAGRLFAEAAIKVVQDLQVAQNELMTVIKSAQNKIEQIEMIRSSIELIADLITLATAVLSMKPQLILAALKEVKEDIETLST